MKKNPPKYSLVIFPYLWQIEIIAQMKIKLKNKIVRFTSSNSQAHVTVAEFDNDEDLLRYISRIKTFLNTVVPTEVIFNNLIFGRETCLILPDDHSKQFLNSLIASLHNHIGKGKTDLRAHISIARKLNEEKMMITKNLFKDENVNFKFLSDAFYLRNFNENTRQYSDIIEKFKFTGEKQPDLFS